MKKFITSTVIVLTLLLLVTGCNKTKNLTDSEKFKEDYESLNKKDNGEVNYINVKINKENPIVYTTPKEVIDKINNKDLFVVYFGNSKKNEKKYLNKEALDWYFAKTSVSFCEDYLCMMRNLNQIDLEYAHCRNRSG